MLVIPHRVRGSGSGGPAPGPACRARAPHPSHPPRYRGGTRTPGRSTGSGGRPAEALSVTTTTPEAPPASSFWSRVPRGARLDEETFATRHRILSGVLAVHPPLLAAFGLYRGVGGILL